MLVFRFELHVRHFGVLALQHILCRNIYRVLDPRENLDTCGRQGGAVNLAPAFSPASCALHVSIFSRFEDLFIGIKMAFGPSPCSV